MRYLLSILYALVHTYTQTSFLPITQRQHNRMQTLTASSLQQNPANVTGEWVFVIKFYHCKQNLHCTFKSERENKLSQKEKVKDISSIIFESFSMILVAHLRKCLCIASSCHSRRASPLRHLHYLRIHSRVSFVQE